MPVSRSRAAVLTIVAALALTTWWGQALSVAGLRAYRQTLGPVVAGMGLACRFTPSCSRYAEVAIARDGFARGGWRAVRRVARCHPWTPMGTVDEP